VTPIVISITVPTALALALIYVLAHPERAERIVSWIFRLFASVSRFADRGYVANDIQANVNDFCAALNRTAPGVIPHKLKISWVQTETREAFLRNGEVIVRLRHHPDQDRNLVAATLAFLGRGMLIRARAYMDVRLSRSIEIIATRKILLGAKRHHALDYFHNEVLEPETQTTPGLREDCQVLQLLDREGYFSRVLLREMAAFGNRVYPGMPNANNRDQVRAFLAFLQTIVAKSRGEDVPLRFVTPEFKVGFVLVARHERRQDFDPAPYVEAIRRNFRDGAETVFLCGEGENIDYVKAVSRRLLATKEGVKEEHVYTVQEPGGRTHKAICVILGAPRPAPHVEV
jgi:hypothetical protein